MKDKKRSNKDIHQENEEMKSRISKEYGGMSGGDSNLPPEIENQFLKNVLEFEKQFAERKDTTVYDRIERPDWVPADEMNDGEIKEALKSTYELLNENGISIDAICEVDDREMYRFITEELFGHEMMDMNVPGMMTCFIYEEFHPNHKHDVKQAVTDFVTRTLLGSKDTDEWFFNENLKLQLSPDIDKEIAIRSVKNFINAWAGMEIHRFEIASVDITDDLQIAHATFEIEYEAIPEESKEPILFSGTGKMKLENVFKRLECVGWDVLGCEIPGFKLLK